MLLPGDPKQVFRGPVAIDDPTGPIRDRDTDRQEVVNGAQLGLGGLQFRGAGRDQVRQPGLLCLQGGLCLPGLGDVVDAHHDPQHRPIVPPEGADVRLQVAMLAAGVSDSVTESLGLAGQRRFQMGADDRVVFSPHHLMCQAALKVRRGRVAHRGIGRIDDPVAQVPVEEDQHLAGGLDDLLEAAQLELRLFALADVLGKDDDSADRAVGQVPGPDLPAHPLHGAVTPLERVFRGADHLARQATPMCVPPACRDLRKDLVMGAADDRPVAEPIVIQPAAADHEVAHLAVEHG